MLVWKKFVLITHITQKTSNTQPKLKTVDQLTNYGATNKEQHTFPWSQQTTPCKFLIRPVEMFINLIKTSRPLIQSNYFILFLRDDVTRDRWLRFDFEFFSGEVIGRPKKTSVELGNTDIKNFLLRRDLRLLFGVNLFFFLLSLVWK